MSSTRTSYYLSLATVTAAAGLAAVLIVLGWSVMFGYCSLTVESFHLLSLLVLGTTGSLVLLILLYLRFVVHQTSSHPS
ncbi:MAG TPA: hypothetical protein O0X90_01350 [Methanocorpusculum sp.]|nr:hypothetical protein [Methanocorpusculum sp.]